jgi:hypothetical protein
MHGTIFYYTNGKGKEVVKALHKVDVKNRQRVQHMMISEMLLNGASPLLPNQGGAAGKQIIFNKILKPDT